MIYVAYAIPQTIDKSTFLHRYLDMEFPRTKEDFEGMIALIVKGEWYTDITVLNIVELF